MLSGPFQNMSILREVFDQHILYGKAKMPFCLSPKPKNMEAPNLAWRTVFIKNSNSVLG